MGGTERNDTINMVLCNPPSRGFYHEFVCLLFSECPFGSVKPGFMSYLACLNGQRMLKYKICWLAHTPGLREMWYEWNLHTQDILFHWNMSTWIHFSALSWPAQKVCSAPFFIPEEEECSSRMMALSPHFCSVIDCFPLVCVRNYWLVNFHLFLIAKQCFWAHCQPPEVWYACPL